MSSDSSNGPGDAAPDSTLAGYSKLHERPPAFEGVDGEPYTVSMETENTPDLSAPVEGYLVFPKWATNGVGVVGHVETPTLVRGPSKESVARDLGELPLVRVKALLDEAIRRRDGHAS
jgi:hypothetical protein